MSLTARHRLDRTSPPSAATRSTPAQVERIGQGAGLCWSRVDWPSGTDAVSGLEDRLPQIPLVALRDLMLRCWEQGSSRKLRTSTTDELQPATRVAARYL